MANKRLWTAQVLVALMASVALLMGGCGAEKKADTPAKDTPAETAEPAGDAAAGAADAEASEDAAAKKPPKPVVVGEMGEVVPTTLEVLQLMPEDAAIAMAVPSVSSVIDKATRFAKRVAPEGIDLEAIMAEYVASMAEDAGVPDAASMSDIAAAKGVDLDAPMAMFLDMAPMQEKLDDAAAELSAMKSDAAPAEGAEPAESMYAQTEKMQEILGGMGYPDVAGVVSCSDVTLAETTLKEILASEGSPLMDVEPEEVESGDVKIQTYGDMFCYFVAGDRIVGGNSIDLVSAVADRLAEPAPIRYGSVDCPAHSADEMVELVRMDLFMPLIESMMPVLTAMNPAAAPGMDAQMAMMKKALSAYGGEDPAVATLQWEDDMIRFLTRVDMDMHDGLEALTGTADELAVCKLFPKTTEAFIAMQLNPQAKQSFQQSLSMLPPEMGGQAGAMMPLLMPMLGQEIAVALPPFEGGMPNPLILVEVANAESTKNMISSMAGGQAAEQYNGVDILEIPTVPFVQPQIAFVDNLMIIATSADLLKATIDLAQAGDSSGFMESLEPPMDSGVSRYSAFMIRMEFIKQAAIEIMALQGGLPVEAHSMLEAVSEVVREVRASQELNGSWLSGDLTVYLNPAQ